MIHSGACEDCPLRTRDRLLVANCKGYQHAANRIIRQCLQDSIAHALTGPVDRVSRTPDHRVQKSNRGIGTHVARCAYSLLERPGFEVEAVRVHQTGGRAQSDRKRPAFAGAHCGQRMTLLEIPADADVLRHAGERGQNALDIELEPDGALMILRQARNHAHDSDIATFPFRGESICEAYVTDQRRP